MRGPQIAGLLAFLVFGMFGGIFCGIARAQPQDFRTHYELAVALYQAQKFEEAIPEFKAAYELDARAGLLFNIAQSYRKAGHPRDAIQYYDRYLTSDPRIDTDTRRKVDGYLAEARNTLAALELEMKQRLAEEKAARERDTEPPPAPNPAPVVPAPAPIVQAPPLAPVAPPTEKKPIYKKAWFWGTIGGIVAAGAIGGIAAGVVVSRNRSLVPDGIPTATLVF